jgi:hypothetical protein
MFILLFIFSPDTGFTADVSIYKINAVYPNVYDENNLIYQIDVIPALSYCFLNGRGGRWCCYGNSCYPE